MNSLQQILSELTDEQLAAAVRELEEYSSTGVLRSGVVREFSLRISEGLSLATTQSRNIMESHVLREAASRWARTQP